MSIKNIICSSLLTPCWWLFAMMLKAPCQRYVFLLLVIIPVGFFFLFGTMDEKMLPKSLMTLPTPYSVIPLYPSRVPLLDLRHFFYLTNNDICENDKVFLVILVHTHPANREVRDAMRKNIPKEDLADIGARRIFLMARAEWNDQELYERTPQDKIGEENVLHRDIVQGNFKEHYHNLTYKHVMGLQWVGKFCPQAKYIIKMDDDISVDLFQFRNLLKYRFQSKDNLILGLLQIGAKPIRDTKSKWFVTKREFEGDTYANFVSGWAYAISADAANKIVNVSSYFPYFWIDDVHITGTLAETEGIRREGLNRFYTLNHEHLKCCVSSPQHANYYCDFIVGPVEGDIKLMEDVLEHARHCYFNHCEKRTIAQRISKTCVTAYVHPMSPLGKGRGEVIPVRPT